MGVGSGITVVVDAQNNTAQAFGSAAKGVKTVGDAADVAGRQLREMDSKLEAASTKARKLADAEERAAEKARRLAQDLALAKHEMEQSGDEAGTLSRKIERLTTDHRFAAVATEEYRRAANRAAAEAREQARAYDRVADNARQAARAVALLGASSRLGAGGAGGGGLLSEISSGFLKQGLGGASSALEGTLGTPIVGPALLAAGAAAAVPAGSFLGGAAGGAVGLGGAAAGAGLGLAGAWMDDPDKFDAMWSKSIANVQKRWHDSSKAFGDELESSLKEVDRALRDLPIEKVLALSQSFVAPLAAGAGGGATAAIDGLADALERAQPIVDEIGPDLANLGNDVGDAFRMISLGAGGGADALGDLVDGVGYAIKAVGIMILGFEVAYEGMRNFAIGAYDAEKALTPLGGLLDAAGNWLFNIDNSSMQAGQSLTEAGDAAGSTANSWGEMARAGAEAQLAAMGLNDSLTELRNTQMAIADANLAVAQGWLDLKEELKDGAKTLDTNTQAGIDNQQAIVGQIELLERQRQQAIATSDGSVEAINAANAAYDAQVEAVRKAAYAAGFDKQKVDELIASLGNVPPNTKANVEVKGLSESLRQGESLRQRLDAIDGRHVEANVYVNYHTSGQSLNAPLRTGGIGHAALGGMRGGLTEVGEEGREFVRLPTGSMVYSTPTSNQLAAQARYAGGGQGGGMVVVVELDVTGSGPLFDVINDGVRRGDIQVRQRDLIDN